MEAGLAARAETKLLRGKDWKGTLAFEAALKLVPNVRDAIANGEIVVTWTELRVWQDI
jgi:hypothetical protein